MKPLSIDLPYPSLEKIEKNSKIAKCIFPLYAGGHGELNAILSYSYYSFNFDNYFSKEVSKTLMQIATSEMEHLEILGNLLIKLGQDAVFGYFSPFGFEYYSASYPSYSKTPQKMLLDAISGELIAISDYIKTAKKVKDELVSSVLLRIRLDEELHVKVLKELLKREY